MKKIFALMLAMVMCFAIFAGCDPAEPGGNEIQNPEDITGEVYDAGNVSALVPDGWKAFPVMDVFSDEEGATDPDALQICKGAETEWDILIKPYVQINHYGPDTTNITPSKDWYDDAEDIDPITTGSYTWNGFTGTSLDAPLAILWTEDGDHKYQITILLGTGDDAITLSDADVLAILASIDVAD
ncbi:MAG: hypothetical protein IJA35_05530 [Clostridia bacterium]|nr:hypothetical protein [Clostridia bacterium]